jgi:hypothetical protein
MPMSQTGQTGNRPPLQKSQNKARALRRLGRILAAQPVDMEQQRALPVARHGI